MRILEALFSSGQYLPHTFCYLSQPSLVLLHLSTDLTIGTSYVAIASTLAYLVYKARRDIPFHWMFMAFGLFIVACGFTHFMEVLTLWSPLYWFSGGVKLITALASVGTAILLPPLVPKTRGLIQAAQTSEQHKLELEAAHAELGTLYARLKELDKLKSQLFANVSHELRTPLTLILGPVDKMLAGTDLPVEHRRDVEVVQRNARTLLKHVNDLLDLAKLESSQAKVTYADLDFAKLFRVTSAHFDGIARDRSIDFVVEAPASLMMRIDAEKIERVLLNLLSNAFKFTPQGGAIRFVLEPADGHILITLRDSGPGIPAEMRNAIFERFRQVEGAETRRFGGIGLGLAIVKEFVELHQGSITVGAAPEGGAMFIVRLPRPPVNESLSPRDGGIKSSAEEVAAIIDEIQLDYRQAPAARAPAASVPDQDAGPLVLVVEDNVEMSTFISDTLARDYEIETAFDGEEGFEKALELRPDLILTDIMMPRRSGGWLLESIRARAEFDGIPIIVLTAKADDGTRVELLQRGAQDYIMKPFSTAELRVRVDNAVCLKRMRDLLQSELASNQDDVLVMTRELTTRRRDLQTALDELGRSQRVRDEFLAMLSHELRTPLTAVLGWIKLIRAGKLKADKWQTAIDSIERNAELLTRLVQDVIDASRIVTGRLKMEFETLDVAPLIRDAVESVRPTADIKGLDLRYELPPVLAITGERERLQQILWNLLFNAVKFTPAGGAICVTGKVTQNQIEIRVIDTGNGITAEFLPHVFEPFRQEDASTTRKHGGLGLGLAITRHLVELHGGSVRAESPGEGGGATFVVTLPTAGTPKERDVTDSGWCIEEEPHAARRSNHLNFVREDEPINGN